MNNINKTKYIYFDQIDKVEIDGEGINAFTKNEFTITGSKIIKFIPKIIFTLKNGVKVNFGDHGFGDCYLISDILHVWSLDRVTINETMNNIFKLIINLIVQEFSKFKNDYKLNIIDKDNLEKSMYYDSEDFIKIRNSISKKCKLEINFDDNKFYNKNDKYDFSKKGIYEDIREKLPSYIDKLKQINLNESNKLIDKPANMIFYYNSLCLTLYKTSSSATKFNCIIKPNVRRVIITDNFDDYNNFKSRSDNKMNNPYKQFFTKNLLTINEIKQKHKFIDNELIINANDMIVI